MLFSCVPADVGGARKADGAGAFGTFVLYTYFDLDLIVCWDCMHI